MVVATDRRRPGRGVHVAALSDITIRCPECGAGLPVTATVRIQGTKLDVDPDLTDVWAHAWAHTESTDD